MVLKNHKEFIRNIIPTLKTQQRFGSERHNVSSKLIRLFYVEMIIKECNKMI